MIRNSHLVRRLLQARSRRQDLSAYKALISTPALGTVTLPAGGRFAFKAKAISAQGQSVATFTSKSVNAITSIGLPINGLQYYNWAETDTVVTVFANFDMYVVNAQGSLYRICGGV